MYFSYHELGIYDLPTMIDYVLYATEREKIFYVGHSEGTTQFLVMTSEKPEYNFKIILMIGLAPAAFSGNIRGPVTKLAKLTYLGVVRDISHFKHIRVKIYNRFEVFDHFCFLLQWVGETFGYPEFRSRSVWGTFVSNLFCQSMASTQFICSNILFLVAGFSRAELNTVRPNDIYTVYVILLYFYIFIYFIDFQSIYIYFTLLFLHPYY